MVGRRSLLLGSAGALAASAVVGTGRGAAAQPLAGGRTIRLVVPFPPGGAIDILGRLLAEQLQSVLGQTVVVENRGGAGGLLGTDAVAKGPNDGSVIGIIGVPTLCAAPFLYSRMPFDPIRDLTPVTQITSGALLCVVNADAASRNGWTDFRALINWARQHPEEVRMGSSGTGTSSHLTISAVNEATGARILHVPYRGGAPAIQDMLTGTIDMMFDVTPALMPHVEAGRFKALALSSRERMAFLPNVPGLGEFEDLGLGQVNVVTWNAIMTAANTPEPVVARLHAALREVAALQDLVQRLVPLGFETVTSEAPAALAELIRQETPVWRRLVEISGAKLD